MKSRKNSWDIYKGGGGYNERGCIPHDLKIEPADMCKTYWDRSEWPLTHWATGLGDVIEIEEDGYSSHEKLITSRKRRTLGKS